MAFTQTRPAYRRYFPDARPARAAPQEWIERSANFVVAYAAMQAGEVLEHTNLGEYFVYLPDGAADIQCGDQTISCAAPCVFIVPPGESRLSMTEAGKVLRIFSAADAADLAATASNADAYAAGAPEVAAATSWPAPEGGFKLRVYRLADYADKPMRMFRSTNLMINVLDMHGPRDTEALSPHSHEDFEQGSFAMTGNWVHSLRYPWSKKMSQWREDEHLQIGSPSLLVIPTTVIHTSRSVSDGVNQLVDIFCPPRRDFVAMGLVCNEADYPPPPPIAAG